MGLSIIISVLPLELFSSYNAIFFNRSSSYLVTLQNLAQISTRFRIHQVSYFLPSSKETTKLILCHQIQKRLNFLHFRLAGICSPFSFVALGKYNQSIKSSKESLRSKSPLFYDISKIVVRQICQLLIYSNFVQSFLSFHIHYSPYHFFHSYIIDDSIQSLLM